MVVVLQDIQRLILLMSMPLCAEFHVRVDICLVYVTSEQHVDTSNRSIATGIIADDDAVNADSAKSVGA